MCLAYVLPSYLWKINKLTHFSPSPNFSRADSFSTIAVKLEPLSGTSWKYSHSEPQRRRGVQLINDSVASAGSKSYSLFPPCLSCMHGGKKITLTLRTHNSGEMVPS